MNKQDALQTAKNCLPENADAIGIQPYFWANFQLIGNFGEITITNYFLLKLVFADIVLWICFTVSACISVDLQAKKVSYP